jgi:hypothetical protein
MLRTGAAGELIGKAPPNRICEVFQMFCLNKEGYCL